MQERFYTVDQIAELLGMHHKTIRKFISEGRLIASKLGKQWRISGHDLSIFMEANAAEPENKRIAYGQGIEYSIEGEKPAGARQRVNVSTVIDINEVSPDEYMRISNTLIALMNAKDSSFDKSTISVKYYEGEKSLKVILWGNINFTEEMLDYINMLIVSK